MTFIVQSIIFALSCLAPLALSARPLSFATLGNMVLRSEPALKQGPLIESRWEQMTEPEAGPLHNLDIPEIPVLSEIERKKLAFLLLESFCKNKCARTNLLQEIDLDALSIISKQNSNQCRLLDKFPTKTLFGHAIVAQKLALPSPSLEEIQKNQAIIKALVDEYENYRKIKESVETIALYETSMLSMFATNHTFNKNVFKELYFRAPEHNKSIKKLVMLRAYQTFFTETRFAIPRIAIKTAWDELLMRVARPINNKLFGITVTQSIQGEWTLRLATIAYFGLQEMTFNYLFNQAKRQAHEAAFIQMKASLMLMVGWMEQLQALSQCIATLPSLQANLSDLQEHIACLLNGYDDEECKQLLEILATGTFHDESSYYLDSARILAAYRLLDTHKDKLVPLFAALGEIDAWCAAAELYLNSQEHMNRYCFVDFVDTERPVIMLDGLWNPIMHPDGTVANTIHLGPAGNHNMIITGPNGSGKSIFMKSVALNLILAQSFGIAAAQSATVSLFDKFHIYLNIQENLELSLSTFMAEKKKMDEICQQVAHQPAGKKSFTLIDEGLKGTVEQSGGPHIYQAGLMMGNNPGNICLLATHFKKPTELEQTAPEIFSNYHLGLLEPHEGTFTRTFKLEKGKNDWWFVDDAKRERFIAWLTTPTI